ncbi:MAG: HD domain-containing protein [Clostridia bacterium]|nr:HD domain-containing protein [Clostridia bacterium]
MNNFDFLDNDRLKKQIEFLVEIDKMKNIFRRTVLIDGSRRENDAEHSWHFAMLALILNEYCSEDIDVSHVIKIAICHDLVEIYAGDTFAYDSEGHKDKEKREKEAADKLFSILPDDEGKEIKELWLEFENKETPESRFANVCDRFQPLVHNYLTNGHTWKEGDVHAPQVLERMSVIKDSAPEIWNAVIGIVEESVKRGILKP